MNETLPLPAEDIEEIEDKERARYERKLERERLALLNRPSMIRPSGKIPMGPAPKQEAPKLRLTPSMVEAGWTVDEQGNIAPPPDKDRGNAAFLSEETRTKIKKARKARKAKPKPPPEPTMLELKEAELAEWRKKRVQETADEGECDAAIRKLAAEVAYLTDQKKNKQPVPITIHYISGLKKTQLCYHTSTKSPLDHARHKAVAFLLHSEGQGTVVEVTVHGPRTGDEHHRRDEVKKFYCEDKKIFDWDSYLGRPGSEQWDDEEKILKYREGYSRPKPGPVTNKPSKNLVNQRAKETRVTFPRHSPRAYIGAGW